MNALYLRRRATNALAMALSALATLVGLMFLAWILWETLRQGIGALNLKLFTEATAQGEDGGLLNSMVGSLVINFIGIGIATPIGVLAGTWLAEYADRTRLGESIRFLND
ncbi:MAG: phosphate ABC transporter, permease protein PstA, partial [Rhodanobacter sp.]